MYAVHVCLKYHGAGDLEFLHSHSINNQELQISRVYLYSAVPTVPKLAIVAADPSSHKD